MNKQRGQSLRPALPAFEISLLYDMQLKEANGDMTTVDSGTLMVNPDVTRKTS